MKNGAVPGNGAAVMIELGRAGKRGKGDSDRGDADTHDDDSGGYEEMEEAFDALVDALGVKPRDREAALEAFEAFVHCCK